MTRKKGDKLRKRNRSKSQGYSYSNSQNGNGNNSPMSSETNQNSNCFSQSRQSCTRQFSSNSSQKAIKRRELKRKKDLEKKEELKKVKKLQKKKKSKKLKRQKKEIEKQKKNKAEQERCVNEQSKVCLAFQQCQRVLEEIIGEVQHTVIRQLDETFDLLLIEARRVNACDCVFEDEGHAGVKKIKKEDDQCTSVIKGVPFIKTDEQKEGPSIAELGHPSSPSLSAAAAASVGVGKSNPLSAVVLATLAIKERLVGVLSSIDHRPQQIQQLKQLYQSIPEQSQPRQQNKRRRLALANLGNTPLVTDEPKKLNIKADYQNQPLPSATEKPSKRSQHSQPLKESIHRILSLQKLPPSKKDITFTSNNSNNSKITTPIIPSKPLPVTTTHFIGGVSCPVNGCQSPPLSDIFKYYSHLYSIHLRRDLHCPVDGCTTSFGTFSLNLLSHHDDRRHSKLGDNERKCPRCPLTFSSFMTAAFHDFEVHARGRWVCQRMTRKAAKDDNENATPVCKFVATTRREWLLHEEQCTKIETKIETEAKTETISNK